MQATGGAVTPNDFLEVEPAASSNARESLAGLRVLLVIAGGIAAYKSLNLIRRLRENGVAIRVVLTRAGREFVTPLSVGAIAGAAPFTDLFDPRTEFDVGHIRLARDNDIIVVAPATADLMAKLANGHADDLATAVLLATNSPVLLAPAMNPQMWAHPATQRNAQRLTGDGAAIVGPNAGEMAEANEAGVGRMAEAPEILAAISEVAGVRASQALAGRHVIVTSGPTHEPIDPVRYIANRSSGKQGHAIAAAAARQGARVTLITGPVDLSDPAGAKTVHVESAEDMLAAVEAALPADVGIFAAAGRGLAQRQEGCTENEEAGGHEEDEARPRAEPGYSQVHCARGRPARFRDRLRGGDRKCGQGRAGKAAQEGMRLDCRQ